MNAGPIVRRALYAESTKLVSLRSSRWQLIAIFGITVLMTAFLAAGGGTDASQAGQGDDDVVVNSLRGVYAGQIVAAVFAVGTIASEYATGTIRATFAANQHRVIVLATKAAVVAAATFGAGLVSCVTSFVVAQPLLHDGGYVPPAYPTVSLVEPASARAVLGAALFLTAVALMGLGLATITRHSAAAITTVVGLLLVPVVLSAASPLPDAIVAASPVAGLAILSTRAGQLGAPIGGIDPWPGLGVTWTWAVGTLIVAGWLIKRRDV